MRGSLSASADYPRQRELPAPALRAPRIKLINFDHLERGIDNARMDLFSFWLLDLGGKIHARDGNSTTRLRKGTKLVHLTRRAALWCAVTGLVGGSQLWLTALGRSLPGKTTDKQRI
jgi:hypothetical protein